MPKDEFAGRSGRIVHDERGNAVWDWIKETSRIAIDSTSRLLKRLDVPELKMEDTQKNNELTLESERDAGGGYDPYGGRSSGGKQAMPRDGGGGRSTNGGSGSGPSGGARGNMSSSAAPARPGANATRPNNNSGSSNSGGGYDPYGKGVTRKPGR